MIRDILRGITDQADYIDLLAVLRRDAAIDAATAEKLVALYRAHGKDVTSDEEARLRLAVDLLPGRERCDQADFAGLGLAEHVLDTVFTVQEILLRGEDIDANGADRILEAVGDETIPLVLRAALARLALDAMMSARNFNAVLEQVGELAAFLSGLSEAAMDKCVELVMEVREKCGL